MLNFNELGVSLTIARWPGDPAEIVPTVTTISLITSAIIYVGCFFAAPAYTSAMGAPAATPVVRVLSILVLSDGFTNTPATLLQRNFRQGQRTISDQVNLWLGTGLTVALAWSGYGAMSLAIGRVAGCMAGAILLIVFAPESLRFGFDLAKARALLRLGVPLCASEPPRVCRIECGPDRRRPCAWHCRTGLLRTRLKPLRMADHHVLSAGPHRRAGGVLAAAA